MPAEICLYIISLNILPAIFFTSNPKSIFFGISLCAGSKIIAEDDGKRVINVKKKCIF